MHAFSANGIKHLTGVGAKTLHHWDHIGFIQPSLQRGGRGQGKGRERLYSVQDIILLKAARMMREAGIPFALVQQVIPRLRSISDIALLPVRGRFLISSTQHILLLTDEDLLDALQRPEQSILWYILELGRVVKDVHQAIEKYTGRPITIEVGTQKSEGAAQSPGPTKQELSAEDYFNLPNASIPGNEVDATVSFDVVWNGPITRRVNVSDAADGFAGSYVENQATINWSASNSQGFSFVANPGSFATSVPEAGPFAELGHEQNGIFFAKGHG